jgi:phosphoglycerol transferase
MTEKNAPTRARKPFWQEAPFYLIALALCGGAMERIFKLRLADLSVPFVYYGDAIFYGMVIKGILTNGWYLRNDMLGMPLGMELHDFPQPDNFSYLIIKLLGFFTGDYARVLNLFFLLAFPLTTLTTIYVLRRFGVSRIASLLGGLLYAFTNYHIRRNENHLMYAAYFVVPLMVMALLWLCNGELSLWKTEAGRTRLHWRNPKLLVSLLICVLITATGGVYYSFFAAFLLLSVALWLLVRQRSLKVLLLPGLLLAVICGGFVLNLSPNLIYRAQHGALNVTARAPGEAELFGLKIAQLLLPIVEHRLEPLAELKQRYEKTPLSNENTDAALGMIGSFGFLFLLGRLLYGRRKAATQADALLDHLSLLNITMVLLGTIGGFGSLFAHLIASQIRAYNRVSVYIAFCALFAVALLLDRLAQRWFQAGWRYALFCAGLLALTLLGVLDQTHKHPLTDYVQGKAEYLNDLEFFRRVEAVAPPRGMVFQLPAHHFPEGDSYDHFKAYFHTNNLRWSYGAMRERAAHVWQRLVVEQPTARMVKDLATAGFCGISNDRWVYKDGGAKLEAELSNLLCLQPMTSGNNRWSYFDLTAYQRQLKANLTESEWQTRQEKMLKRVLLFWRGKFYGKEGTVENNWRWCGAQGELRIENHLPRPRRMLLEMTLASNNPGKMQISSPFFSEQMALTNRATPFSKTFELPPGTHSINFNCDAQIGQTEVDKRELVFRVNNFKLVEQD